MHRIPESESTAAGVPATVRRLDAELNGRVIGAATEKERIRWMREKHRVKQRLVILPDRLLDSAAADELARLQGVA